MRKPILTLMAAVLAGVTVVAQQSTTRKPKAKGAAATQAKIRLAMTGAPADISKNATIMDVDAKGQMN